MSETRAMKRLQLVIAQIQHENKSLLSANKCSFKGETNAEEPFISHRTSSHQASLKDPEVKMLLSPTNMQIKQVDMFDVHHLDDVFETRLHRYPNKWVRPSGGRYNGYVGENDVVLVDIVRGKDLDTAQCFKRSGARREIVWAKGEVKAAIVTCGGLCPGLNNVIAGLVNTLHYNYGVDIIFGINSGYSGFWHEDFRPWERLTPKKIAGITELGGTYIRSDRGGFRGHVPDIINGLLEHGVNQVYIVGGDGTHRAANILQEEMKARKLKVTVAGVPKTIDNDIGVIDRSFGFNTSVAKAKEAILSAVTEAKCAPNCVGIVKLMGRHAGYISAMATLASHSVNLCMIPEVDFKLDGPTGILPYIESVIKKNGFAVIVVAEGAGGNMITGDGSKDRGGNLILPDIGNFLKKKIVSHFEGKLPDGQNIKIKYHDPSYMIRSIAAAADDAILCSILAGNAVHGSMAGFTGFTSGQVNYKTVMIPMEIVTATSPSYMNKNGRTWERVVAKTHQPRQS